MEKDVTDINDVNDIIAIKQISSESINKDNYYHNRFWWTTNSELKMTFFVTGAGAPLLCGTSDFRSRSCAKRWQLRNIAFPHPIRNHLVEACLPALWRPRQSRAWSRLAPRGCSTSGTGCTSRHHYQDLKNMNDSRKTLTPNKMRTFEDKNWIEVHKLYYES